MRNVRSHRIEIPYSDKFYSILYVESENLKYYDDGEIHLKLQPLG